MMARSKTVSYIGFATKAGRITIGTEITLETVRKGKSKKVFLVLCASDASNNTKKRVTDCGAYYKVPVRELGETISDLSKITGKVRAVAVIGITDEGFANAILKSLVQNDNADIG